MALSNAHMRILALSRERLHMLREIAIQGGDGFPPIEEQPPFYPMTRGGGGGRGRGGGGGRGGRGRSSGGVGRGDSPIRGRGRGGRGGLIKRNREEIFDDSNMNTNFEYEERERFHNRGGPYAGYRGGAGGGEMGEGYRVDVNHGRFGGDMGEGRRGGDGHSRGDIRGRVRGRGRW